MVPVSIAPIMTVVFTVNIWLLGNIFILLMKIQLLKFLVQPGSSANSVPTLLQARLSFMISPSLPMNIFIVIPKQTLLSTNMMTTQLRKATFLHLQILPAITKGRKQVIKILMIFNGRVHTALRFPIKLIPLTLEEIFHSLCLLRCTIK